MPFQADLLLSLASELVIPRGVFDEIMDHDVVDSAVRWLSDKESSLVAPVEVPASIAEWNLGKGESEVIAFAFRQKDFVAAIDDRPAKRCPLRSRSGVPLRCL